MNKIDSLKIGFIGCGKMASAIIKGVINSEFIATTDIKGSEVTSKIAQSAASRLGIEVITDNKKLAHDVDVIFVATKPSYVTEVLEEIKSELTSEKLVVSIAAGVSTKKIEDVIGQNRVIRVMPNTPALILEGMSGVCKGSWATDGDSKFVVELLSSIGKCIEIEENLIDIVTAISGSGPAFFYKVIEDIARAGEKLGMNYDKALLLATQTAIGSAKMVLNRGETPVKTLIDNVATKGGCTSVGITTMNEEKSDELFYDVIANTTQKAASLGS